MGNIVSYKILSCVSFVYFLFILTTVIQILFFFETYLICIIITPFFVVASMHFLLFVFRKDRTKIREINTIRVTLPFLISITSSLLFYFSRILYRIDFPYSEFFLAFILIFVVYIFDLIMLAFNCLIKFITKRHYS